MEKTLDLYTDYLISSFGQTSATSLSRLVDGDVSHDFISRLLSNNEFTAKTLWEHVKPLIRKYETENACLIFDDVVEKKYTQENEITCWHYDHSEEKSVKGFNILNAFYHSQPLDMSQPVRLPISFEIIKKTIPFCVIKTKKTTRVSPITKNEMMK